jgi:hypothetical protein
VRCNYIVRAPVAEPHGNIWITKTVGKKRRKALWSAHALREFCEATIRKLDAWEAEQNGRVVPLPKKRKKAEHG